MFISNSETLNRIFIFNSGLLPVTRPPAPLQHDEDAGATDVPVPWEHFPKHTLSTRESALQRLSVQYIGRHYNRPV